MSATSSVSDVDYRIRRSSLPPLLLLLTVPLCLSVVSVRGLVDSATDVDAASSNARQARAPAPAVVAVTQTVAATPAPDPREFCEAETFQPQCSEGEVVMVTDATYGRMQLGRCVRTDYGYVGCQADVMVHLDSKCSGRRTCELRIPDAGLDAAKKCPDEFKTYLNVSHDCIPVESAACLFCSKVGYAKLTMQSAFIGSVVTAESQTATSCGSSRCPWVIEVQSGQTINITLFDFAMEQRGAAPGTSVGAEPFVSPDPCFRYAVVKETPNSKPVPVCGGHGRTQLVYASVTNSVEIHIVSPEVFSRKGQFVLHYEAVGCPDFPIPPYAEMRREGDKVQVTCLENTSEVWERRCVGTQWIGEVRTCPAPYELTKPADGPALPIGLLIAIVLGIALVIGVFIVTVGVVCLKRQRRDYAPPTYQPTYYVQQYQHGGQCYELREDLELPVVDQVSFVGGGHGPDSGGAQSKYCGTLPPPKPPRPYVQQQQPGQHHHQGRSDRGFGRENVYAPRMDPQRPLPSLPNIPEAAATAEVSQQQQQQQRAGRPALQFQRSVPGSSTAAVDPNCPCNQPTRPAAGAQQRQMSQPSGSTVSNPSSSSSRGTVVPSASEASTVLARGRIPSLPCSVGSGGPSQHYTVLDPTEVQHLLQSGGGVPGASAGGIGSGAMQSSCSGSVYDPTGYGSSFQYQSSFDDVASCGSPSSAGGVGLVSGGGPVSGAGVAVGGVVSGGVSGSSGQLASGHEIPLRPARETSQPRLDSAASCAAGSGCSENSSWP